MNSIHRSTSVGFSRSFELNSVQKSTKLFKLDTEIANEISYNDSGHHKLTRESNFQYRYHDSSLFYYDFTMKYYEFRLFSLYFCKKAHVSSKRMPFHIKKGLNISAKQRQRHEKWEELKGAPFLVFSVWSRHSRSSQVWQQPLDPSDLPHLRITYRM